MIQEWGDDPLTVAQSLASQGVRRGEVSKALNQFVVYFDAFTAFRQTVSQPNPDSGRRSRSSGATATPNQNTACINFRLKSGWRHLNQRNSPTASIRLRLAP
ncbi:MAG: hypothetical protein H6631_13195 [Anaerolineaceae bacterium]|nr:hypothetical protein [Anaerolineaceae bacterium]